MSSVDIEQVSCNGELLGIIVRNSFSASGIRFFTPESFSQQLGYMHHEAGTVIGAHVHNHITREVTITQEVLVLKSGSLRVDFYDQDQKYVESRVLHGGDIILLVSGGHGFEVLEEIEMFEIKQGPFVGEKDKTRFEGIRAEQAVVID